MTTAADSRERPFLVVVGKRPEATDVIALYGVVGWGEADDYDEDSVRSALTNTLCIIHATDPDGRLIGFARLFGNGVFHTSLAEIVVHPGCCHVQRERRRFHCGPLRPARAEILQATLESR